VTLKLFLYLVSVLLIILIFESQLAWSSRIFGTLKNSSMDLINATSGGTIKAINICCSWNKNLSSENVSYSIFNVNGTLKHAIEKGLKEWSEKKEIKFVEVPDSNSTDIRISFIPRESASHPRNNSNSEMIMQSGLMVGKTIDTFDGYGHINHSNIIIYGSAFGTLLDPQTLQNVAAHEIGHALGLGHASFGTDLMFNKVSYQKESVSKCDINGVLKANQLKFSYSLSNPNMQKSYMLACY
jgi:predicted Zn-dependent protease